MAIKWSKKMNRYFQDRVRIKFAETNLPKQLREEAILCSAYENK